MKNVIYLVMAFVLAGCSAVDEASISNLDNSIYLKLEYYQAKSDLGMDRLIDGPEIFIKTTLNLTPDNYVNYRSLGLYTIARCSDENRLSCKHAAVSSNIDYQVFSKNGQIYLQGNLNTKAGRSASAGGSVSMGKEDGTFLKRTISDDIDLAFDISESTPFNLLVKEGATIRVESSIGNRLDITTINSL